MASVLMHWSANTKNTSRLTATSGVKTGVPSGYVSALMASRSARLSSSASAPAL